MTHAPNPLYEFTGHGTVEALNQNLEANQIIGRVTVSTCGRTFIEIAEEHDTKRLEAAFGRSIQRTPASMPKRKRGKALTHADYVEILNAPGTPEQIASAVDRPVSTVKRALKLKALNEQFTLIWVEKVLADAGLIHSEHDLLNNLPQEGDIAALFGRKWWMVADVVRGEIKKQADHKAKMATLNFKIAEQDHEIAALEYFNAIIERGSRH